MIYSYGFIVSLYIKVIYIYVCICMYICVIITNIYSQFLIFLLMICFCCVCMALFHVVRLTDSSTSFRHHTNSDFLGASLVTMSDLRCLSLLRKWQNAGQGFAFSDYFTVFLLVIYIHICNVSAWLSCAIITELISNLSAAVKKFCSHLSLCVKVLGQKFDNIEGIEWMVDMVDNELICIIILIHYLTLFNSNELE